ncbi:MAG: hypothetical protein CM1200mP20_05950 [Pseudomonadota bacterium]|nr:MAG: hypothetical protein CM1200mP20_05950 [Pseudomonadota bacterium]
MSIQFTLCDCWKESEDVLFVLVGPTRRRILRQKVCGKQRVLQGQTMKDETKLVHLGRGQKTFEGTVNMPVPGALDHPLAGC